MSAFTDARDSFYKQLGVQTGIAVPSATKVGQEAGNGVINLATSAFSNLFRSETPNVAGSAQGVVQAPVSKGKVSVAMIAVVAVAAYFLLKKKGR